MADDGARRGLGESIALMALMVSLVALSIDAMLPALPDIGADLAVRRANDNQLVISALLLGLAGGQILYGPLSDSFGRKPLIVAGLVIFMLGCVLSMAAQSMAVMLAGRVLQGFGAAGPRIVTVALVRDQFSGPTMARIMSFVMAVFILVPALAPAIGQGILIVANWRAIFATFLAIAVVALFWLALRQSETLPPQRRMPLGLAPIARAVSQVCTTRAAIGFTIAMGLIFGAFVGYLNSAQQILQQRYALGVQFPLYFAVLALSIGGASMLNARLVTRFEMRHLCYAAFLAITALSTAYYVLALVSDGVPTLWSLMAYLMTTFFCVGILFGNLNALAMQPLGHVAGVGAAFVGFLSTLISVPVGTLIGQSYGGTVLPLVGGFALLSLAAFAAARWAASDR